jgi:hypothetical protein
MPLHMLLCWRGTKSTSPWTEFTGGVTSRKEIHSRARRGIPINERFSCIGGRKDYEGPPLRRKFVRGSMIHIDGDFEELQETTNIAPLPGTPTIGIFYHRLVR